MVHVFTGLYCIETLLHLICTWKLLERVGLFMNKTRLIYYNVGKLWLLVLCIDLCYYAVLF